MILRHLPIGVLVSGKADTWNPAKSDSATAFYYIDLSSIDRSTKEVATAAAITPAEAPSRARQIVLAGDVLVSTVRPNLNGVAIVPNRYDGATASTGFSVLRPDRDKINGRYLFHWVRSPTFIQDMERKATGASYPAVSDAIVKTSQIPVPPLAEQRRIAAILDKADAIRRKRREAIALTEELLRSTFLEMFGDPVTNPKGWLTKKLGELCTEIYRYPTFYGTEYVVDGTPVVRIGNIELDGRLQSDLDKYVKVPVDFAARFPRTRLELGDVLMAVRGDGSTASRIGWLTQPNLVGANMSPNLLRFKADPSLATSAYLFGLLTSQQGQALLLREVRRTAKKTITATGIRAIGVPVPGLDQQVRFAAAVTKIQRVLTQQRQSAASSDNLFHSLVQRAFRGEL